MNTTSKDGNQPSSGLRGDPGAPRTPTDGTRDPQSSSAASSADPLPSEPEPGFEWRLHRVPPYPPGGHGSWVETNHPAVVACMGSVPECAENGCQARIIRKEAAADPALRTLSQQWKDEAVGLRKGKGLVAATLIGCAADLDRLCPEIRDEQKESTTDPV